jgi:hypothetical protein
MEVRFALETEVEVVKGRSDLVDQVLVQLNIHDPFVPGEQVHPAGTLRAMQVTAVSRFDRKACRTSPGNNSPHQSGKKIAGKKLNKVNKLGKQRELQFTIYEWNHYVTESQSYKVPK